MKQKAIGKCISCARGVQQRGQEQLLFLIACSDKKKSHKAPAGDLYLSERFVLARKLADSCGARWFIVSASHGLLEPTSVVSPYDKSLQEMGNTERRKWWERVSDQLQQHVANKAHIVCLGDKEYFREISKWLMTTQNSVFIPFQQMSEDQKIPWLQQAQQSSHRARDVARLYAMLGDPELREKQYRSFSECSGSMCWPKRGLYIFYHHTERRMLSPSELKIVRVGTHAVSIGSSSTLWQRLKTHRGNGAGGGNHRASIFRLHVGTALIARDGLECPSWGIGQSTSRKVAECELEVEKKVSDYIREMGVLCLTIDDPPSKTSDRAYIEQNIIALLSGPVGPVDLADESWLGYHCLNLAVRRSSLWNVNYTNSEYDPDFFPVLQAYINASIGRSPVPKGSLAPKFWSKNAKSGYLQKALSLD